MKRFSFLCLLVFAVAGCSKSTTNSTSQSADGTDSGQRPKVAYVTNGVASFWVIAESGVRQGGQEFDADVEVLMPAEGISDQKRMIEDLLTKGVDGIAVSPIDPANQTELLNKAAKYVDLITHDSDAPESDRTCYIGMDNYLAGRMCGDLVKEAMPEGGKLAIFIGRLEQDNSRRRRQGVIDSILERSEDPSRFDPPDAEIKQGKWHIVGTYTDQFDRAQGKANAEDAMSRHPDLGGMVGLFAYNPPLMLGSTQAGKANWARSKSSPLTKPTKRCRASKTAMSMAPSCRIHSSTAANRFACWPDWLAAKVCKSCRFPRAVFSTSRHARFAKTTSTNSGPN